MSVAETVRESPAPQSSWPSWHTGQGYRVLARYASAAAMARLGLFEHGATRPGEGGTRTQALYERLRKERFTYNTRPLEVASSQRVRDPEWVVRDSGTCLDLSLMFATMCIEAGLRPYLCMADRGSTQHAFVLVDLEPVTSVVGLVPPCGWRLDESEQDVYWVAPGADGQPTTIRPFVAVDVTAACRLPGLGFDEASRYGWEELTGRNRSVRMVDVLGAQHAEPRMEPFLPVKAEFRPAITRRLPPRPLFTEFGSRDALLRSLTEAAGAGGLVVLHGASGLGKSMLAYRLAASADNGCGWFLDAFDNRTLKISLGEAELDERGNADAATDEAPVRDRFAALAHRRLRESRAPWVVVADNVSVPPDIDLPRPSAPGQLVVVTTTVPDWRTKDNAIHVDVPPLDDDEVRSVLGPDAPVAAIDGRPLLVSASARFRRAAGTDWWDASRGPADPRLAPFLLWEAARDLLGAPDCLARRAAAALAWLPPVPLTADLLTTALYGLAEPGLRAGRIAAVRDAADLLASYGLADIEADRVSMHRLFREAVRRDQRRGHLRPAADEAGRMYGRLLAALDRRHHGVQAPDGAALHLQDLVLDPREDIPPLRALLKQAEPAENAARALHALGRVVERQDTPTAARIFFDARELLKGQAGDGWSQKTRLMLSDCLRGMARDVMRRSDEPLGTREEALEWAAEAIALASPSAGSDDPPDRADRLARSRAEAMLGLLLRQRAGRRAAPDEQLKWLRQARVILERSAAERAELAGAGSPDVDRSLYNLGGLEIRLAQVDDEMSAADHLDRALRHYKEVYRIRFERYRTEELEEVVCCVNGYALVEYYRAILLAAPDAQRLQCLRRAGDYVADAVRIRQQIGLSAEGEHSRPGTDSTDSKDSRDTAKSLELAAKITLARLDLRAPGPGFGATGSRPSQDVVDEYADETAEAASADHCGDDSAAPERNRP